jgi:ankyrin repeat protein
MLRAIKRHASPIRLDSGGTRPTWVRARYGAPFFALTLLACGAPAPPASDAIDVSQVERVYAREIEALLALRPDLERVWANDAFRETWSQTTRRAFADLNILNLEIGCWECPNHPYRDVVDFAPGLRVGAMAFPGTVQREHYRVSKALLSTPDGEISTYRVAFSDGGYSAAIILKPPNLEISTETPLIDTFETVMIRGTLAEKKALVSRLPDVNERSKLGGIALHSAAFWGPLEIVELLVARGADPHARDESGSTALHSCAVGGQLEIATYLIAQGLDVNAGDSTGVTPLHRAARNRKPEMATLLLRHGADVNAAMRGHEGWQQGETPLHGAVQAGDLEMATLLIEHGANVNARESGGFTPLHTAALRGLPEIAVLLLEHGADPGAQDIQGSTPLDLAERHPGVAEVLRRHAADD